MGNWYHVTVTEEIDRRVQSDLSRGVRLRPDEWKCGEIGWIVDLAGDPRGIAGAIEWLKAGPFRERDAKIIVATGTIGAARVETLRARAGGAP